MLVLKKRDLQFAMWFVLAVLVVALASVMFLDRSKVPGIVMSIAFLYALFWIARKADREKQSRG